MNDKGSISPAEAMRRTPKAELPTTYFRGDLAIFTGKTENLYGATFREVILMEGHLVGQTRLVKSG